MDINSWLQAMMAILDALLKHPESSGQWWTMLIGAFLAGVLVLRITAAACGMERGTVLRSWVGIFAGLALILLSLTAVKVLSAASGPRPLFAAAMGTSVLIIVPLICYLLRGNYFMSFFSWVLSLAAMGGVVLMLNAVFDLGAAGLKNAEKAGAHRQELEQTLGGRPAPAAPAPRR